MSVEGGKGPPAPTCAPLPSQPASSTRENKYKTKLWIVSFAAPYLSIYLSNSTGCSRCPCGCVTGTRLWVGQGAWVILPSFRARFPLFLSSRLLAQCTPAFLSFSSRVNSERLQLHPRPVHNGAKLPTLS